MYITLDIEHRMGNTSPTQIVDTSNLHTLLSCWDTKVSPLALSPSTSVQLKAASLRLGYFSLSKENTKFARQLIVVWLIVTESQPNDATNGRPDDGFHLTSASINRYHNANTHDV